MPADRLVEVIWGERSRASAPAALQSYVSRLRRILGADSVIRENHAYVLVAAPESVDAICFERLVILALDMRDEPARCRKVCQEALALWRGVPFGDLADDFPFRMEAIRLDEIRQATMELCFETDLALGHHDVVVRALEAPVEEHPYREGLWYLLIEALTLQQRRLEALRVCHRFRTTLGDVGMDPGGRLTTIEDSLHAR